MGEWAWLDRRLDRSRWTLLLVAGDIIVLTAFIATGVGHHTGASPLAMPTRLGLVVLPFFLGWFLVALVGGLYTATVSRDPRLTVVRALPAWGLGALFGLGLRATPLFPGGVSGLFPVVIFLVGVVTLVGWRVALAFLIPRISAS